MSREKISVQGLECHIVKKEEECLKDEVEFTVELIRLQKEDKLVYRFITEELTENDKVVDRIQACVPLKVLDESKYCFCNIATFTIH